MFRIVAEPIGVMTAGFLEKKRWKKTVAVYDIMLVAYFIHPYERILPLWTVLDLLTAFLLITRCQKLEIGFGRKTHTGYQ